MTTLGVLSCMRKEFLYKYMKQFYIMSCVQLLLSVLSARNDSIQNLKLKYGGNKS